MKCLVCNRELTNEEEELWFEELLECCSDSEKFEVAELLHKFFCEKKGC